MKKITYSTNDINKAAILMTVNGINIKTITFNRYEGEVTIIYKFGHSEVFNLQLIPCSEITTTTC